MTDENERVTTEEELMQYLENTSHMNMSLAAFVIELTKILQEGKTIQLSQGTPVSCAICGSSPASGITLIGGYSTTLCNMHRNQWHVYVLHNPYKFALDNVETRWRCAVAAGNEQQALLFTKGIREAELDMFEIAEEWVEALKNEYEEGGNDDWQSESEQE